MVLPSFLDFPKIDIYTPLTLPEEPSQPMAVLTEDPQDEELLRAYSQKFPSHLVVAEVWKELLPDAPIFVSSAICGGQIRQRFELAAKERPCWLLVEPMCHRFPLPCLDAKGEQLCSLPEADGFFSPTLCCRYTHFPGSALLWDTEQTLSEKLRIAKEVGFLGYVVP